MTAGLGGIQIHDELIVYPQSSLLSYAYRAGFSGTAQVVGFCNEFTVCDLSHNVWKAGEMVTTPTFLFPSGAGKCFRMVRNHALGFRALPDMKAALHKAATEDSRSLSSLIEKVLGEWLIVHGYLPRKPSDSPAKGKRARLRSSSIHARAELATGEE
jgi:hypothetical protein